MPEASFSENICLLLIFSFILSSSVPPLHNGIIISKESSDSNILADYIGIIQSSQDYYFFFEIIKIFGVRFRYMFTSKDFSGFFCFTSKTWQYSLWEICLTVSYKS